MSGPAKPDCDQIVELIADPFVVIDREYRIVAANRAYRERYAVGTPDVVGRLCHEVSHRRPLPCSARGEHCPLEEVVLHRRPAQVVHLHFDREGREQAVQLSASPLLDEAGNVRFVGEIIVPVVPAGADDDALLVGRSQPLLRMIGLLQRVARTSTTVLLLGESGVGKERVAQYLHHYSNRSSGPFVVVDCGALGESLVESELFGHEKGSFTGASQRRTGLLEAARGGTLFLDEIGDLSPTMQTRLLRVLETGTVRRVGGTEYRNVDVRIVAATHRDIARMVDARQFREDLYYRLGAFPITVPTLRERKDDIPRLAEHFLSRTDDGDRHLPLSPDVIETLLVGDYPGNVRELRNVVERAAILACGETLRPEHVVFDSGGSRVHAQHAAPRREPTVQPVPQPAALRDSDHAALERALQACRGHRGRAAAMLGISERTLYRRLRRRSRG